MILEKAETINFEKLIRDAQTIQDIADVFQSVFGVSLDTVTPNTYQDQSSDYGVRVRGVKSRERLNEQARAILDRVKFPEDLTDDEKAILKQYSGKGGLTENSQYEYYTPAHVAGGIWDSLAAHGFKSGNVLDPCTGAGVFSGTKPNDGGVTVTGCDIDPVGSKVAALLNPGDVIENKPFEAVVMENPDNTFDAIVGNVPFGDARGKSAHLDPEYKKEKRIERYFILRALDKVKPGGLCAFVVPINIVGAKSSKWEQFRIACSKKAEFLGAHKLPSKTFSGQGTDTVVDVVVFKKHGQDLLDRIPDLPFDVLKQARVVWDEFIQGQYWMGEGKPFIMGKYVPKIEGDRWSRETVDGDIDSGAIRQKLAARFHSRIDWDLIDATEPIVRNYIDGDRRMINGTEYELISGQWVKVEMESTKNAIDKDMYGAESAEELASILADNKAVLKLTADQMWAAYKSFPNNVSSLQKQAVEFAMSQSNDAIRDQLFRGSIIGGMIGRYHQSVVNGDPDDSERMMLQDIVTNEIMKYGHPKNNSKLTLTGESSRMFGLFLNAVDEQGNFSDLLAGTMETKRETQYDSGNVQSIVEHLYNREGIENIELADIKRLYTGQGDLTLADIAGYDNLAITPELMIVPMARFCSGDIFSKIQGVIDAMASDEVDAGVKTKWRKQIEEIDRRRVKVDPENITFGLRHKWFSPEYVVNFLRENGYPGVDYVVKREVEWEDPVTGQKSIRFKKERDFESPFGEFVGIHDNKGGFPNQFLEYLNGGNVKSSGTGGEERTAQYKNQAKVIEENFNVWMKQHLDIAELGKQYDRKFNGFLAYEHDGSDLGLQNVSAQVKLHDYQNVAIRRMSEDGMGILGYDVGLGKTFSALGLIAYNQQMGRSQKTCIVVPGSVLANWYHSANSFYGNTNDIFVVGLKAATNKKTGEVIKEVVLDETGNPKKNKHTGEVEYQDKLKDTNDTALVFEDMWKIPGINKKIVIMTKDRFGQIPMMAETKDRYTQKMLTKALISSKDAKEIKAGTSYDDATDQDHLEQVYSDEGTKKAGQLPFLEMMGFTDIIVDEGHIFKNSYKGGEKTSGIVYLPTPDSAQRALDMTMKLNAIRDANNGRGAYILTATPVTNSPIEIFNMLSLVCDVSEFERFGVYTVDDFVRVFGDIQQVPKQRVAGDVVMRDGLTGFQNLSGLRSIFHKYVLLKNADDVGLKLPPTEDIHDGIVLTQEQNDTYEVLREMAKEAAKPGKKRSAEETLFGIIRNMDRVTTDMDLYRKTMTFVFRLEDRDAVIALVKNLPKTVKVKGIDEETKEKINYDRGLTTDTRVEDGKYILVVPEEFETHVVTRLKQFGIKESDVSHPVMPKYAKLLENMKTELETGGKQLVFTEEKTQHDKIVRLMVHNIPMISDKIGIINADTAGGKKLQGISDSYNSGKLSVIIANKKAEVGVNLQKGTTAIHHLTLPWTPASIQQRNGRGVRQGNTAKNIRVYYYLGRGSFDEYRLDLLERKANWIRDLFNGSEERAENANAFNADDYLDMLEADPEAAKQKRLEKLEQKRREEQERERKRLANQLQVLISISTTLSGLEAAKADVFKKSSSKVVELMNKVKQLKTDMASTTDDETRIKISEKLVAAQQALNRTGERLAGLDQEFQKKQTDLEARRKQITGYMRGLDKKGQLPFSNNLIDHPETAIVTLAGDVVSVGDTFEHTKDGTIFRIVEVNVKSKEFKIESITTQWGGGWVRNLVSFLSNHTRVSYSQSELDVMKMLAKEHVYSDLLGYDKAMYVQYANKFQFKRYGSYMFVTVDGQDKLVDRYDPDDHRIIFPEPNDPDFVKRLAIASVLELRSVDAYDAKYINTFLSGILGEGYNDILNEYRKSATETEILTACATIFKEWSDSQADADTVTTRNRISRDFTVIRGRVVGILSEYDNRDEIINKCQSYVQAKADAMNEQINQEKALAEQRENEALKANPNFKEVSASIKEAFKKIGITVEVNPGNLQYRVSKYKSETAKPFSRWLFQDSAGMSGRLYKTKEILKARYGAKFFKDEGKFTGAWWHLPSTYSLDDIFKLLS